MIEPVPQEIDVQTGLPVGPKVADPRPAKRPGRVVLEGRWCRLEPLDPARHCADLFRASTPPDAAARFPYLPVDAPKDRADVAAWMETRAVSADPLYFAVIDGATGRAEGRQSLMRIDPPNRSIEIGDIYWGPAIARSRVTTEANYLFAAYAFDTLGNRRYEWKCNALNAPSRLAAIRRGFSFEGLFRRSTITKGRSRDTAWYAMIDEEWPRLKAAYETWLDPQNFDAGGRQRRSLSTLTKAALDP